VCVCIVYVHKQHCSKHALNWFK